MEFTVENICGFLIRSRLLSPEEVKSMYQRWQGEAQENTGNLSRFTRWLVAKKYVTEYQASLLMRGQVDDFFLNQYQILDRIGRGRMAGVYKAVHHLGQVVAIKVLPPSKAKDRQILARFQREAGLAIRLNHPNVVRSFQLGEANHLPYLVMEYLEGETLEEVLQRRRRLPANEAVRLIYQGLRGLQHIHEKGMVHRDLKPANLMLIPASGRGEKENTLKTMVKILDIGLGRQLFEEGNPSLAELTGEGVILGTPDYLAPEQARDSRATDIRADIYSLGCVLYHCLTGQPPFPDRTFLAQMLRHASEIPKPLKDFNPALPDGLQLILSWMMAKKPEDRYPTPERAAQALQVFLVADSQPVRPPAEEAPMHRFLTWLETAEVGQDPEAPSPSPVSIPALPENFAFPSTLPLPSQAVAPPAGPSPAAPSRPAEPETQAVAASGLPKKVKSPKNRRQQKGPSGQVKPTPVPVAQPAPAAPSPIPLGSQPVAVDVELVSLNEAAILPEGWRRYLPACRRDWIFLGIGAAAVILAGILGMILAMVFG